MAFAIPTAAVTMMMAIRITTTSNMKFITVKINCQTSLCNVHDFIRTLFKCSVRASGKIRKPERSLFRPVFFRGRKYSSRRAGMLALPLKTSCFPEDDLPLQGLSGCCRQSGSGIFGSSGMAPGLSRSQNMSPCCRQKKVRKTSRHPDS